MQTLESWLIENEKCEEIFIKAKDLIVIKDRRVKQYPFTNPVTGTQKCTRKPYQYKEKK